MRIERHTVVAKSVGILYYHMPFSVTAPDHVRRGVTREDDRETAIVVLKHAGGGAE